MKKIFIIVACMQSVLGCGMDKFDLFMHKVGNTYISVMNGCISEVDGKTDILVVGVHEQYKLETRFSENLVAGDIGNIKDYINIRENIYGKHIDCFKHFDYSLLQFSWKSYKKPINSCLLSVVEPRVGKELQWNNELGKEVDDFTYITHRRYRRDQSEHLCEYYGSDALEEAKKDLALCYKNALEGGEEKFSEKSNRSIAFKSLSTQLGFPRREAVLVTIAAITEYIIKNPKAYTTIDVFVDNYCEVELYRKAFERIEELLHEY